MIRSVNNPWEADEIVVGDVKAEQVNELAEKYFGNWGMLLIMLPVTIGYGFGIFYFVKLEKEVGNYP